MAFIEQIEGKIFFETQSFTKEVYFNKNKDDLNYIMLTIAMIFCNRLHSSHIGCQKRARITSIIISYIGIDLIRIGNKWLLTHHALPTNIQNNSHFTNYNNN